VEFTQFVPFSNRLTIQVEEKEAENKKRLALFEYDVHSSLTNILSFGVLMLGMGLFVSALAYLNAFLVKRNWWPRV